MRKEIFITILLLILVGCNKYNEDNFICDCGEVEIDKKEYIAMCVIPQEVTANTVNNLRIENHTKKDMSFGTGFSLEYLNENNWIPIDLSITLNDGSILVSELILLWVNAGETKENVVRLNLYWLAKNYNNSQKGKYRIIKKVDIDKKEYTLYAEFEIK